MMIANKKKCLTISVLLVALIAVCLSLPYARRNRPDGTEEKTTTLKGHRFPILALAFAPDGSTLTSAAGFLATTKEDVEVIVWDVAAASPRATHTGLQNDLFSLALSNDGKTLATGTMNGTVRLWDTTSSKERRRLNDRLSPVSALAVSANGNCLASSFSVAENCLMLWDAAGNPLWSGVKGHKGSLLALAFAPDEKTLASGGPDTTVRIWDVTTGDGLGVLRGHTQPVMALAHAPDGRTLASGDCDGVVKLWDLSIGEESTGEERAELPKFKEEITALAFAPDGRTLAVASGPDVELWDVAKASLLTKLSGHEGKVFCLAFSPDGKRLASGSFDKTVRLWDLTR